MSLSTSDRECLGLDEACLTDSAFGVLRPEVVSALAQLQKAAQVAGFDLRVASAFRSYERQRRIWNGKLSGRLPVLDDHDAVIELNCLEPLSRIERVMRFSALPGASRHHWGTDVDVFDASVMPSGYRLGLTLAEVAPGGLFDEFHQWLDERIEKGDSFGFFRPYDRDRGGVSPERWHLSYAPVACHMESRISERALKEAWRTVAVAPGRDEESPPEFSDGLLLRDVLEAELGMLLERFVLRVATPPRAALEYQP